MLTYRMTVCLRQEKPKLTMAITIHWIYHRHNKHVSYNTPWKRKTCLLQYSMETIYFWEWILWYFIAKTIKTKRKNLHKLLPLTALRLPLSALRLPLTALWLPLTALWLPLTALRLPLTALRLPLTARRWGKL